MTLSSLNKRQRSRKTCKEKSHAIFTILFFIPAILILF